MSADRKARVAVTALAALLVWPIVHFVLVERWDLNPWKFCGFAMYCQPSLPASLVVEVVERGERIRLDPERQPDAVRAARARFLTERSVLGTLRSPEPLARLLLASRPGAEEIRLDIRHAGLDAESGLVTERLFTFEARREDLLAGPEPPRRRRRR